MNKREQPFQIIPETFKVITKCPVCDRKFSNIDAKLLEENTDSHLIYISCRQCHTSIMALVVFQNVGIISYGLITDLTEEEVLKYKGAEAIDDNFVLRFYNEAQFDRKLIEDLLVSE